MKKHIVREFNQYGVRIRVEESIQKSVLGTLIVKPAFVSVRTFLKFFEEKLESLFESKDGHALAVAEAIKTIAKKKIKLSRSNLIKILKQEDKDFNWSTYIDLLVGESFVRSEQYFIALKVLVGNGIMNYQLRFIDDMCSEASGSDPFMAFGLGGDIDSWRESIDKLEEAFFDYCVKEKSFTEDLKKIVFNPFLFYECIRNNGKDSYLA